MPDHLQDQIKQITNTDFQSLMSWMMLDERRRRSEEKGKADLVLDERRAGLRDTPAVVVPADRADEVGAYSPWEDPGTIHDRMYGLGDRVRHQGRVWESTHPGLNHWAPGGEGVDARVWRDVTDELTQDTGEGQGAVIEDAAASDTPALDAAIPAWAPGMQLASGDLVTHDGQTWRVKIDHTSHDGWRPGPATHAVFEQS